MNDLKGLSTIKLESTDQITQQEGPALKNLVLNLGASWVSIPQPLQMIWKPQEDITAYELALCMPYLCRKHPVMPFEIDKAEPHFRHFEIIEPI